MTALPSFVELMASLGLENNKVDDQDTTRTVHSRSSSYSSTHSVASRGSSSNLSQPTQSGNPGSSSPSIVISRHPSSSSLNRESDERRRSKTRYSPYSPSISHMRRGSAPSVSAGEDELQARPSRALSSSPLPNLSTRTVGRRSSALSIGSSGRRPEKLSLNDGDFMANTPISTFVRRRTPQSSPISPTFPHRKRSSSPSAPVLIPTLPTFIFPQLPTIDGTGAPSSDSDDEFMDVPMNQAELRRTAQHKLTLRRLRASRRSDSNISLARSSTLESPLEVHRLTPVA